MSWRTQGTGIGVVAALAAACALSGELPANAETLPVEDPSHLISRVAPDQGEVLLPSQTDSGAFATDDATIPTTARDPILILGNGVELPVTPPKEVSTAAGQLSSDGTVVYNSRAGGADFAVQALDSGAVRMQTVINSARDPHEYTYELGNGFQPVEAADGTFWAYRFNDAGELELFGIGAAWARDATAAEVATHYEIRGNALVQVVQPKSDAAYPIVADPTWEWYSAAYGAGFSKAETRDLTNLGGIAGFCTALAKWPALGIACGIAGAQWWTQAGLAVNANGCVFIAAVPAPLALRWVSSGCR